MCIGCDQGVQRRRVADGSAEHLWHGQWGECRAFANPNLVGKIAAAIAERRGQRKKALFSIERKCTTALELGVDKVLVEEMLREIVALARGEPRTTSDPVLEEAPHPQQRVKCGLCGAAVQVVWPDGGIEAHDPPHGGLTCPQSGHPHDRSTMDCLRWSGLAPAAPPCPMCSWHPIGAVREHEPNCPVGIKLGAETPDERREP